MFIDINNSGHADEILMYAEAPNVEYKELGVIQVTKNLYSDTLELLRIAGEALKLSAGKLGANAFYITSISTIPHVIEVKKKSSDNPFEPSQILSAKFKIEAMAIKTKQ